MRNRTPAPNLSYIFAFMIIGRVELRQSGRDDKRVDQARVRSANALVERSAQHNDADARDQSR
jgi:hypothetical protein